MNESILASGLRGLPWIDVLTILAYFSVVIWIGYRAMKRIKNQEDYFLAGRRFGRWIQTFAAFGQGTSAESAVTATTMVTTSGAAGIGASMMSGIFGMPMLWMVTPWYRRMRYLSLADFFAERYNSKKMAGFYACSQAVFFVITAAAGFVAMSKTVAAITVKPESALTQVQLEERAQALELRELESLNFRLLDETQKARLDQLRQEKPTLEFSYINRTWLMIVLAVIVLIYAVSGGLEAAFVTDMIQGIFIIILTVILIPFAMLRVNQMYDTTGLLGPFQAMHKALPDSFFQILGSPNLVEFTWYWIVSFGVLGIINVAVQANQLTAAGSAKDDETARIGFVRGIFMKRYCGIIWGFVAMLLLLLYGNTVSDPDYVWGTATRDLLGSTGIGLVGLMIACLMAALMSTADALMLTTSALITHSVYRPLVPGRSEGHYVNAGRVFCIIYIAGGVLLAVFFDDVFGLFKFMIMFNAIVAASFWMGMLWRRANRVGAWTSIVVTFAFTLLLPFMMPLFPGIQQSEYLAKQTLSYEVINTYTSKQVDVDERNKAIAIWDQLNSLGKAEGQRPQTLAVGESFEKIYQIAAKSIFWQQGVEHVNGAAQGKGLLKVELVALDLLGMNLARKKYALNESLTILLRIIVPFGLLIAVSLLTKPEDKLRLNRFYGKMRTPSNADHQEDARQMQLTMENPTRFDHLKLFPNSNWEFRKWNRKDWIGQIYVVLGAGGVALLLVMLVTLGR